MYPYTDFKNEQPGLGNGWDPSMNQGPPSGYNPPANGPPQTTAITPAMPSPHQMTDPIYSYPGNEINGFDYHQQQQQQQQQQTFYQHPNQYYPPANNTSPTINGGGGGGSNFIHDATYHNGYPQTQGPTGPPPPGNGLTPTPPPSVQVPQNSPSQPPTSNANHMSYYQQCNPQQPGMQPSDIRQTPAEQVNYDYNSYPQQHYPPVNGHSQWSPTAPHQQHYALQQQQQQQQPYIKNELDPQSPYSMKSEQLSPYGMDSMQQSPGASHNSFDYHNSHHMNPITHHHSHPHQGHLQMAGGRVPPPHNPHLPASPNHSMHFMGGNNVSPLGPHPGFTDQQHLNMVGNLKRGGHPSFNSMGMGTPFNGNGLIPKPPNGNKRTKDVSPLSSPPNLLNAQQPKINDSFKEEKKPKAKRGTNRFNGMSEEEIAKRGLPDYLCEGLDIVFIGINPSMFAAYTGKYYDGPGNHFWQALYLSGIIPEPMTAGDDHKMLKLGIGFTNIVARTTKGVADLTKKEIQEGSAILREKLCRFNPKVAVFNGKAIYEVYSGQKKFMFGRQPQQLPGSNTWLWVMPSSSARCAQLPRVADKVPFFMALRKFRDHLHGLVPDLDDSEVVFSNVMLKAQANKKAANKTDSRNEDEIDPNLEPRYNGTLANVPQSVSDVIEDVIQKYNSDFVMADSPASGSSTSDITNQSPASSYQDYSNIQSNQVSQQQPYHSPHHASGNSPSHQNLHGFQNQNMTGTHPSSINTTPLPAMHTLTRSNRVGVGYYE